MDARFGDSLLEVNPKFPLNPGILLSQCRKCWLPGCPPNLAKLASALKIKCFNRQKALTYHPRNMLQPIINYSGTNLYSRDAATVLSLVHIIFMQLHLLYLSGIRFMHLQLSHSGGIIYSYAAAALEFIWGQIFLHKFSGGKPKHLFNWQGLKGNISVPKRPPDVWKGLLRAVIVHCFGVVHSASRYNICLFGLLTLLGGGKSRSIAKNPSEAFPNFLSTSPLLLLGF